MRYLLLLALMLAVLTIPPISSSEPSSYRDFVRAVSRLVFQSQWEPARKEIDRAQADTAFAGSPQWKASLLLLEGFIKAMKKEGSPEACWKEALSLFRQHKEKWGEGATLLRWGSYLKEEKHYPESRELLTRSALLLEEEKDFSLAAVAHVQLFTIASSGKDDTGADSALQTAADLFDRAGDLVRKSACYSQWSDYYYAQGSYEKALSYQEKAIETLKGSPHTTLQVTFLLQHANILSSAGRDHEALPVLKKASGIAPDDDLKAQVLSLQGDTLSTMARYEEAISSYGQAAAHCRKSANLSREADMALKLSSLHCSMGEMEKSEALLASALSLYKKAENLPGEIQARKALGDMYFTAGQAEKSRVEYEKAFAMADKAGDPGLKAGCLCGAGRHYYYLGDYGKAESLLLKAAEILGALDDPLVKTDLVFTLTCLGDLYGATGKNEKAEEWLLKALAVSRQIHYPAGEITARDALASLYLSMGAPEKTLDTLKKALSVAKALGVKTHEALINLSMGRCFEECGDQARARDHYDMSLRLNEEQQFEKGIAHDHLNLGYFTYYQEGNADRSEEHLLKALALYRKLKDRNGITAALEMLGSLYKNRGMKEKALQSYHEGIKMAHKAGDGAQEQSLRYLIGLYAFNEGDIDKGLDAMEACARYYREHRMEREYAGTLVNLSRIYLISLGNRERAANLNRQALAVFTRLADNRGIMECRYTEFKANRYSQRVDLSRKDLHDLVERARKEHNNRMLIDCLDDLSCMYVEVYDNPERAHSYMNEAIDLAEKAGEPLIQARVLSGAASRLINFSGDEDDHEKALHYIDRLATLSEKLKQPDMFVACILARARLQRRSGAFNESMAGLEKGLSLPAISAINKVRLHSELLTVLSAAKKFDAAGPHLKSLEELSPLVSDRRQKTLCFLVSSAYHCSKGDYRKSKALIDDAINCDAPYESGFLQAIMLEFAGELSEMLGNKGEALGYFEKAIAVQEEIIAEFKTEETSMEDNRSFSVDLHDSPYGGAIGLLMEKGDREKAFMLGERDRARWFLKKIGNPVWPRIPEEKVNAKIMAQIKGMKECAGLFQALSTSSSQEDSLLASHPGPAIDGTLALALRGRGERGDAGARKRARAFSGPGRALSHLPAEYIEQYKKKYMEILPLLKLENREYHSVKTIAPTPLKEIQACLDDHSLLLEYYIDRHRIYLFALTPTEITCHSLPYSQEALIDKIASFRQKIIQEAESGKNAYTPGVLTHARALYTILLKPVEKELEGKKRIVLVPHRELHDLPFAALVDGKDMPLAKTYSFCYLPSASALPLCREKTLKKKSTNTPDLTAFALGNVVMEGFSPLPGTNDEVKKLKEIFPSATISLEKNFTLDQVARLAPGATYLHLATHGITDMENPHFSGILASDGILFVDDIFGSLNLHNCQLATLSACQTARGKIPQRDERIAVSRALFYAGAPAIVVSLWNVSDESTSKLMVYFYEYLKTGMAKDEALEKAEQRLMEAYPQPYHWASFILMGDWESSAPGGKTPGDTRN